MRTGAEACRRVFLANVGKQKKHQQATSPGVHVDAPVEVIRRMAAFWWKAAVNMPARIARIFPRRKPNRKCAQIAAWPPTPRAHQLVVRLMQHRRVGRSHE